MANDDSTLNAQYDYKQFSHEKVNILVERFHNAKAFFYDCDGTLVDSEKPAMEMVRQTLFDEGERQGKHIDQFYVMSLFGKTIPQIIGLVEKHDNIKFPDDIAGKIHQNTVKFLTENAKYTDGMPDYLDITELLAKANKAPHAVVTSSGLDRVAPSLEKSGLEKYFKNDGIFSAVDTLSPPQPKPDPKIYLHTSSVFNVEPSRAVTHEDSGSGALSANRAGIGLIIGYTGGSHITSEMKTAHTKKLYDSGAHIVFDSWTDASRFFMQPAVKPTAENRATKGPEPQVL